MKFRLKYFEINAGKPVVFINKNSAKLIDIHVGDRVKVSAHGKKAIAIVDITKNFIEDGEIALSEDIKDYLDIHSGEEVSIMSVPSPRSSLFIAKKMNGKELKKLEIKAIIDDIVNNNLSEAEIAQFVLGVYRNQMTRKETIFLTEAMFKTGKIINWHSRIIADKHSIGGVAGNRTTPIIVAICASAGIVMPKTSSRAITSAAGTADTMETIAKVDFPVSTLKEIVRKTGACLAWGGSLGLSPADDKLIKIERILKLDPESQLIASILSKKLAAGSKHVLIDIPYGTYAKVSASEAKKLKEKFLFYGKHFGLDIRILLTNGNAPIGNGIGPVLEMIDILKVLQQKDPPKDLEKKSLFMAGQLLEMMKKAPEGKGEKLAKEILISGRAYQKFKEIIEAQHGSIKHLKPAKFNYSIKANRSGTILAINNHEINKISYILGCPLDKSSGIYINKHAKNKVKKDEIVFTIYAESNEKIKEAKEYIEKNHPFVIK